MTTTNPGAIGLHFRVDGVGCLGPGSLWNKIIFLFSSLLPYYSCI